MSQSTILKNNLKNRFPMKKIILAVAVCILVVIVAFIGFRYIKAKDAQNAVKQTTAKVERGDLSVTVSGSGAIRSSNKYDITSNVNGTVTKINFKDGDKIKAGDVLIEMDDQDAKLKVRQLENSIAQAKLSQDYNRKYLSGSRITAPISGEITDLQVKAGDNISKNGTVLTITDKSRLKMLAFFNNKLQKELHVGDTVTVNALDTATDDFYTVKGSITNIGSPSFKTSDGSEVYNVEAAIINQGSLKEGMVGNITAMVSGKEIKSVGSSTLYFINSTTIKSESGGVVEKLNVEKGQIVAKGNQLLQLQNDDLVLTTNTDDLKLQDLQIQQETATQQLSDYKITAPIDGTFTLGAIKQGNSIKSGESLGSIANYDTMEFDIPIDELDIAKIEVGQTVKVTVDALPETNEKPLKGTVSKIAIEGTSSNGVTTYPVTIQLEANASFKGGMNANAEIIISSKENVLYLPVQAVQKRSNRSIVMVKSADGSKKNGSNNFTQGNSGNSNGNRNNNRTGGFQSISAEMQKYYANAVMKPVKTGISNDEFIEIESGLTEGETVILPPTVSSQSSQQSGPFGGGAVRFPVGGGNNGGNNGGGQNNRRN